MIQSSLNTTAQSLNTTAFLEPGITIVQSSMTTLVAPTFIQSSSTLAPSSHTPRSSKSSVLADSIVGAVIGALGALLGLFILRHWFRRRQNTRIQATCSPFSLDAPNLQSEYISKHPIMTNVQRFGAFVVGREGITSLKAARSRTTTHAQQRQQGTPQASSSELGMRRTQATEATILQVQGQRRNAGATLPPIYETVFGN
jgi:hypothetical protein